MNMCSGSNQDVIYLLQDEFVEERALQMSADKQGSQIIEVTTTLKLQQLIMCHNTPTENLLILY
jgi:hypothetical protein